MMIHSAVISGLNGLGCHQITQLNRSFNGTVSVQRVLQVLQNQDPRLAEGNLASKQAK
jgi:hypothetical protein